MIGIAEMFSELDGYQRLDEMMEEWRAVRRAQAVATTRAWDRAHPERARAHKRKSQKKWRKAHPTTYRALQRAADARRRADPFRVDRLRQRDRINQAFSRAFRRARRIRVEIAQYVAEVLHAARQ